MSLSPVFALYRSLAALLARFQRHAFTRRGDFCDSKKHLAATHGQRRRSTHKPEEAPSLHGTLTVQIPAQCPAASYGSSSFGPRPSDYTVTPPSSLPSVPINRGSGATSSSDADVASLALSPPHPHPFPPHRPVAAALARVRRRLNVAVPFTI